MLSGRRSTGWGLVSEVVSRRWSRFLLHRRGEIALFARNDKVRKAARQAGVR